MKRQLLAWAAVAASGAAQAAGTLTVCTDGAPDGFDIVQYESLVTEDAAGITLYDKLLAFKPGTTQVGPGLAERWDISADGLAYTFHLRKGVKFHTTPWFKPTRDLNADDVLWSINRVNDKAHPAHGIAKNGYAYWAGMEMPALIKSIEKLDAMTRAASPSRAPKRRCWPTWRCRRSARSIRPNTRRSCRPPASSTRSTPSPSAPARSSSRVTRKTR